MIWTKVFGRPSILGGWWFGMMWTGRSSNCSEASIPPSVHFSIHPFLQNHHGGKYSELIPSAKQQRRPLSSLLSLSFFYGKSPKNPCPQIKEYVSYWERTPLPRRLKKSRLTSPRLLCSILHYLSVCVTAHRSGWERLGESTFFKTTGECCLFSVGYIFFASNPPTWKSSQLSL